jgi:hypothetical protein
MDCFLAAFLILDAQIEPGHTTALEALELSRTLGNVGLPGPIYQIALVLAVHGKTATYPSALTGVDPVLLMETDPASAHEFVISRRD